MRGEAALKPHSNTQKAVHVPVTLAPPKKNKSSRSNSRSNSRSPRGKKTGFVNLEKAGKNVKMDDAMKNH